MISEAKNHEQLIKKRSVVEFAERDKCKPVLPRLSLARNLEKQVIYYLLAKVNKNRCVLGNKGIIPVLFVQSIKANISIRLRRYSPLY